jgi:GNAT superfamily N-acetyltransferase
VVRRRAGRQGERQVFSDVLGELVGLTETDLTIRTRQRTVRVPAAEVTHAKRIPDRRRPSATEALERVAAAGWPAPEQGYLGEWLLRAAGGWTARGNSALPIGDPGLTLPDAVDAVQDWYRARHLPPKITVPGPTGGQLTEELTQRGWSPAPPTLVQVAALSDVPAATSAVLLEAAPSDEWFAAVAGYKGALPDLARGILTGVQVARYAEVRGPGGGLIAAGRGVIADPDRRWLGISLLTVDPGHRRRGLGRAVVGALASWAAGLGATQAYLQVEQRNTAAVAMYGRIGFSTHHAYVTWAETS